jgi:hypothetical protein
MTKYLLAAMFFAFCLQSCYYDNEEELYPAPTGGCDTAGVTYSGFVANVISQNCALGGCHGGPVPASQGRLDGYANTKDFLDTRKATFINAINHVQGVSAMPKGGSKLPACTIQKIEAWISSGYPNN